MSILILLDSMSLRTAATHHKHLLRVGLWSFTRCLRTLLRFPSFPRSCVGTRTLLTIAAKLRKAHCVEISACFSVALKPLPICITTQSVGTRKSTGAFFASALNCPVIPIFWFQPYYKLYRVLFYQQ